MSNWDCVPSLDSFTNIHTWAHLALATQVMGSWVNDGPNDSETQSSHMSRTTQ